MENKLYFDYNKLKGRIVEVLGNQSNYAKALNLSETSITNKLNNVVGFTQKEIYMSLNILGINNEDISTYFFTLNVGKTQQNEIIDRDKEDIING